MKVIINGKFLSQRVTGLHRFAIEIVRELDKLISADENYELYVPKNCEVSLDLKNIRVVMSKSLLKGILWDVFSYNPYVKREKGLSVNLCNGINLHNPNVACIHDVIFRARKELFYETTRDILRIFWNRFMYSFNTKHSDFIVTVSEFSKKEIIKYYNVDKNKIFVINNAWQHINRINDNKVDFQKSYPFLLPGAYFFSISTLAANKNFKWVLHAAKNNPEYIFAIAGGGKLKGVANSMGLANLPNVKFLGYVTDEEAKCLMKNCKAFIFPSLYEGFGIPPLEALGAGCKNVILSDIEVLHEIYADSADYVDPTNLDYKIQNLGDHTAYRKKILDKYSWQKSALSLYNLIKKVR